LIQTIIEENDCGLFAEAGDAHKLAENIKALQSDPERVVQQGTNARAYIEQHLSRKICTGKICEIIDETGKG
jgi:glycosyltransferase involved in cell wall biosynthesis